MDGILTSPLKTPNPFNHQLHGRKPFDTHLNDARTGTEFFQKFGDSAVYALSFDPRIKSNRGWVEKSLYASDFSADADGWTAVDVATVARNAVGIGGTANTLEVTIDFSGGGSQGAAAGTTLSTGAKYKVTIDHYGTAGSGEGGTYSLDFKNGGSTVHTESGQSWSTWNSTSFTFTATGDTLSVINRAFGTSDNVFDFHNVTIKQVIKNPVVHVLRDSDSSYRSFTAPEVASGVMLNWVTDGAPTANGLIHTAYDPSGNGNDATQTTVANMPKIVDAGTLVTDALGNVAGLFDGTDDYLLSSDLTGMPQPFTVITISSNGGVGESIVKIGPSQTDTANSSTVMYRSTGNFSLVNSFTFGDGPAWDTNVNLLFAVFNGASSSLSKNGSNTTGITTGTASGNENVILGGQFTNWFDGKLQAAFIFNADMSSQRPAIEAALAQIYGITLA